MKEFIGVFLFTIPFILFTQSKFDFTDIDHHATHTPKSAEKSIKILAEYLTKDTEREIEKTRAIFIWITENIRYDVGTYYGSRISPEEHAHRQKIKIVLKNKKAVCQGYALLFNELCTAVGIKSEQVTGYTKNNNSRTARSEHAWNAVRIDSLWFLIDCTWGAGTVNPETRKYTKNRNEEYFLAEPKGFLKDHFPHDPVFQLITQPIMKKDFDNNRLISSQSTLVFPEINKTLDTYSALKSNPEKELDSAKRVLRFDSKSAHAKYQLASNYFNQASDIYDEYRVERMKFMGKERELTNGILNNWEQKIAKINRKLNATKPLLDTIKPGTQYFKFGRKVEKSVKEFESFLKDELRNIRKLKNWMAKQ